MCIKEQIKKRQRKTTIITILIALLIVGIITALIYKDTWDLIGIAVVAIVATGTAINISPSFTRHANSVIKELISEKLKQGEITIPHKKLELIIVEKHQNMIVTRLKYNNPQTVFMLPNQDEFLACFSDQQGNILALFFQFHVSYKGLQENLIAENTQLTFETHDKKFNIIMR